MDAEMEAAVAAARASKPELDLRLYSSESGEVVLRVPGHAELSVMRKRSGDPTQRAAALENLVRTCLVYPSREKFNAIVDQRPMLTDKWAEKLVDAAGAAEVVEEKKL